jgi:hypothetical protein
VNCQKCGAEAAPDINTSLCPECLKAQKIANQNGCLVIGAVLIAFILICAIAGQSLTYFQFLLLICGMTFATTTTLAIMVMRKEWKKGPSHVLFGAVNPVLVCPHCQTKGFVRRKLIRKDVGISSKKATAAALTGGVSLLATGLSRKEWVTQSHCDHCGSTWNL